MLRTSSFEVNHFVKVNSNRGTTPGKARITKLCGSGSGQEADIVYDNGMKDQFYTAHLYKDAETIKATIQYHKDRAAKIGNITRPKKRK